LFFMICTPVLKAAQTCLDRIVVAALLCDPIYGPAVELQVNILVGWRS
jgi:hypothetical protein